MLFPFPFSACPVCYLPMEQVLALMPNAPSFSPVLKNLTYIHEENLTKTEFGGSEFGGYPSLRQRSDSYVVKESMNVHCGYGFYTGKSAQMNLILLHGCLFLQVFLFLSYLE